MATTQDKQFFNLHVSGIGYLNRVRWVNPGNKGGRRSEPFLACGISALRGSSDAPAYTYFDLRVSGEEAISIVDNLQKDVDDQRTVVLSFRVGDIYPHLYERDVRDNGRPTGAKENAVLIKGRLLLINTITVDGERVYTRELEEHAGEAQAAQGSDDADQASEPPPQAQQQAAPRRSQASSPAHAEAARVAIAKSSSVAADPGRRSGLRLSSCRDAGSRVERVDPAVRAFEP